MIYPIFIVDREERQERDLLDAGAVHDVHRQGGGDGARDREAWRRRDCCCSGCLQEKDEVGSDAYSESGIIQEALRAIRQNVKDLLLITDICLCEYTSHGHCGVIKHRDVDNDSTLKLLADTGVSHARAGADMVAPSDMMDGRVAAIRGALDNEGFANTPIMAYSAKYASAFYGPFREAADSAPQFGDRRSYQMDPPNAREALKEIATDIQEGADIVMVKPAMAYLDVIARARRMFNVPIGRLSGQRRVFDDRSRCPQWLDRSRTYDSRNYDRHQTRRGRHPHHLLRARTGQKPMNRSEDLFARALQRIPGGVNSPVRAFRSVGGKPLFIARGEGIADLGRRWTRVHRLRRLVGTVAVWSSSAGSAG